jgi:uncharacterized membrane protein YphA (DoxX/SURF4 family)
MKIAALIARLLLGLMFTVFGLNGFFHFIPGSDQEIPGLAGQFIGAMVKSHYILAVSGTELVSGLLLLVNRYVPLALVLIGPVIFNIILFHVFLAPANVAPAIVTTVLWFLLAYNYRSAFSGILQNS